MLNKMPNELKNNNSESAQETSSNLKKIMDLSSTNADADQKETIIKVRNLNKSYQLYKQEIPALVDINLDILKGEFVAIIGHSGSGKTTLLNLLGLIDNPTSGEIWINNQNTQNLSENEKVFFRLNFTGFIFQFFNLLENFSAIENIAFQLRLQGYNNHVSRERALEILKFLGLEEKANRYPRELSGGEQQRIAVGRALAKDSILILADEPTANLDSNNGQNLISILKKINTQFKKTIILVTHEFDYASQATRIITIKDGRITA